MSDGGELGQHGDTREEAVGTVTGAGEGLERTSATTLSAPGM